MHSDSHWDAVIVGSGPNGLCAAITLAATGARVLVLERSDTVGGGMRSRSLTLDGFTHDVCSAIHPLAIGSPMMRDLPLGAHGLEWVHPDICLAHPLDDGTAVTLHRSIDATTDTAGCSQDAARWRGLFAPLAEQWDELSAMVLGPVLRLPKHPRLALHFARLAIRSAAAASRAWFNGDRMQALFAGLAAHAMIPLERRGSSAAAILLAAAAHAVGWPFPRGGAQRLADALAAHLRSLGGTIETNRDVARWDDLPEARVYLFDTAPGVMTQICGERLPGRYHRAVRRYRYGMGVFKIDWALREPIPWTAMPCRGAATVHLGGLLGEIEQSERDAWEGRHSQRPFVLLAQHTVFDATRAPAERHTAWAYCHVPHGSTQDMTAQIEAQVERFAPGFADCMVARHVMNAHAMEQMNPNYVSGDINGGAATLRQMLCRPVARWNPYTTPNRRVLLCSAATPPGGGVHGMCGWHAAKAALRQLGRPS